MSDRTEWYVQQAARHCVFIPTPEEMPSFRDMFLSVLHEYTPEEVSLESRLRWTAREVVEWWDSVFSDDEVFADVEPRSH